MSIFRRGRKNETENEPAADEAAAPEREQEAASASEHGRGPWDEADQPERGARVDLGALWVPSRPGLGIRLELEKGSRKPVSAQVLSGASQLTMQAFAAPRSRGIWDEVRDEMAAAAVDRGGLADDIVGPFGRELITKLPAGDGRITVVRLVGVDGPRWFLRGLFVGPAVSDADAARPLEDVFADTVVVRGAEALPPRELLPLRLPGAAVPEPEAQAGLDPFRRGPEITEVR